jgi:hypothetical protein
LEAWWRLIEGKEFSEEPPSDWRNSLKDKVVEIGWLDRNSHRQARYVPLTLAEVGL